MSKHFAKAQVSSAVRTCNGPDTSDIHSPHSTHMSLFTERSSKSEMGCGNYSTSKARLARCSCLSRQALRSFGPQS